MNFLTFCNVVKNPNNKNACSPAVCVLICNRHAKKWGP